ncbi:g11635 [Coccomyxa elongata]
MRRLCQLGGHPSPAWLSAWEKLDALQLPGTEKITHRKGERAARVKPINFPEDNLVDSFYARNADAKQYPVQINSFQPHPARVFAWRQMQLMQQGMSKGAARRKVQEQFDKGYASRQRQSKQNTMATLQRAEERVLISALNKE